MPGILRILPIHFVFLLVAFAAAAAAICNAYYDGQKSAALRAGAPAAIPLSRLGPVAKYPTFQEIRVEAQTSDALVYVSWFDSSRGMIEYPIVFFVDPAHEGPVQEVLAAAPFVGSDLRNFEAFMAASARGYGPIGRILEINGARKSSQSLMSDEYAWAAMDMGLSLHPDFVVIDPFTEGREAGLATQPVITYALGGVRTGRELSDAIEVNAGLNGGETIVAQDDDRLRGGDRIETTAGATPDE